MIHRPRIRMVVFAALLGAASLLAAEDKKRSAGLVAHWPLAGDVQDHAGGGFHAANRGASLTAEIPGIERGRAAKFDGRGAHLSVPHADGLRLGTGDFTLALWVHTDDAPDDILGDLLSKYDHGKRIGLNLTITHRPGVTHSQANYRQIHFGLDDGRVSQPQWTDHGRPGSAMFIQALAVHDGSLYAGTCEPGKNEAGHVYRLQAQQWIDCGAPDKANAICSLASFGGKLYAGTGKYRLGGSALAESENPNLGGKVYRYEGEQQWQLCGQLPDVEATGSLVNFRGELFATSLYRPASFLRYEGSEKWQPLESPFGKRAESLMVFGGQLFASCYDGGKVFRFGGNA
ncbi:MAG TPA: hypothetical protein VFV87_19955, partial [Pirellulaceae bacterium]|nr:hypothetical protein [Pirellulaceae bacterium]